MEKKKPRTHDILGDRLDDPEDQLLTPHPFLLPVAIGFTLLSAAVAVPLSIPVSSTAVVDVMRPSERFACWVLGRKFSE